MTSTGTANNRRIAAKGITINISALSDRRGVRRESAAANGSPGRLIAISCNGRYMPTALESQLFTHEEARRSDASGGALAALSSWVSTFPMNEHAELGRPGTVCPFVKQASRLDILRLSISEAGPEDEDLVFVKIRGSFEALKLIPAPNGKERLRTIIFGFPGCASDDGIAMLERVYKRHKYYTLLRSRMIAFFHAGSETHGLWNPGFRPMRSPMPILAVRYLVEQDAVFAAKHKLLTLPYLLRFGPAGARRLIDYRRRTASD